ncbi:hypothetical protein [Phenylobacterium sp.]|jgi:uncharacterized protein YecT (DUF1311 family)|uniref:hypothetical protein n=1 Tax=Phenylobacterium sp. TaxID=1871053 RepID=UPI0037852A5E
MQLDLSTLSGPELRQLLDSARQRGQAAQSYQILKEMDRRRAGDGGRRRIRARRSDEPRVISLDLGDPMSRPDPALDAPPPPSLEDEPELTLPREPRPKRRPLRPPWTLAGFAAGLAVGAALGVNAASTRNTPIAAQAIAPPVEVAPAPLPSPPAPIPAAAPVELPAEPSAETLEVVVASPDAQETVVDASAKVAEPQPVETTQVEGCASAPTPADRVICADPSLQKLQRELRDAYAGALAAHEARGLLRERQLAWREARNDIAEPARLTRMYEDRIRKLNAAAEDARRRR